MIWPRLFPLNRLKGQKKEDNNNKGKYYMNAWKVEKLTNLIIFQKIFVFYKYGFFFFLKYFLETKYFKKSLT